MVRKVNFNMTTGRGHDLKNAIYDIYLQKY